MGKPKRNNPLPVLHSVTPLFPLPCDGCGTETLQLFQFGTTGRIMCAGCWRADLDKLAEVIAQQRARQERVELDAGLDLL